ncbi:hypothetical protein BGZ98_001689, partial [Dissophora globulifera]
RAKNFKGIQGMAIATGGFLIGSQIGLVMGAMASVRTIQSIPNFQRVLRIVQEVRDEAPGGGGVRGPGGSTGPTGSEGSLRHDHVATMPSAGHHRFTTQPRRSELMSDEAVAQQGQGDGYHGGNDPSNPARLDQNSAWAHAQERAKELQSNSNSWNQIRHQNMPKSAWVDVREGRRTRRADAGEDAEGDEDDEDQHNGRGGKVAGKTFGSKPSLSGWDRMRQGDLASGGFVEIGAAPDGPSDFARTREDLESRPSRVRNQYGDST